MAPTEICSMTIIEGWMVVLVCDALAGGDAESNNFSSLGEDLFECLRLFRLLPKQTRDNEGNMGL